MNGEETRVGLMPTAVKVVVGLSAGAATSVIVRVGVRQIFNGVMSLEGACRTIAAGSQSVRDTPHLMETVQVMETVLEVEERTRGAKRTTILDSQKSSQISPLVWAILCLPVQITARVLF